MNRKIMTQIILGSMALLFLFGCKSSTPTITLTVKEKQCTYDGPQSISKGDLMINLNITQQKLTETGFSLFTLEAGKTIEDVRARTSPEQPPWVITVANVHEMAGGNHTYSYNTDQFAQNALYKGGPLYLACFRTDPDTGISDAIGLFGPIELK